MTVEFARRAQRDLDHYVDYLADQDEGLALREISHIEAALEWFAGLPLDGVVTKIRGWPRPIRKWPMHPFIVFYERRLDGLYVVRLYHHARRPIERP